MGSTVLNGAKIAKNCIVEANSLVRRCLPYQEGVRVMGQSATIIRILNQEEIKQIQLNADRYVINGNNYDEDLIVSE